MKPNFVHTPLGVLHLLCALGTLLACGALATSFAAHPLVAFFLFVAIALVVAAVAMWLVFLWRKKKMLRRPLVWTLVWACIALAAANETARWVDDSRGYWTGIEPHDQLGWRPRPNLDRFLMDTTAGTYAVTTDALGCRNAAAYPADGVLPVMIQGDSNVFGFGLHDDETLAAVLNLRTSSDDFYNFGAPGYDLNQYYYQYELAAEEFTIRRRVIVFNLANDFTYSALKTAYYMRRPYLDVHEVEVIEHADDVAPYPVQAYGNSFVDGLVQYDALIAEPAHAWATMAPALLRIPLARLVLRRSSALVHRLTSPADRTPPLELNSPDWLLLSRDRWPPPFQEFAANLPTLLASLQRQNSDLVICLLPMRSQVVPDDFGRRRGRLLAAGYHDDDVEPLSLNRWLARICREQAIACIDLTPTFRSTANPASMFQAGDDHLSASGVAQLADILLKTLDNRTLE